MKFVAGAIMAVLATALFLRRTGTTAEEASAWIRTNVIAELLPYAVLGVAIVGTYVLFRFGPKVWAHLQRRARERQQRSTPPVN